MFQRRIAASLLRRLGFAALLTSVLFVALGAKASSATGIYTFGYDQDGELGDGGGAFQGTPQQIGVVVNDRTVRFIAVAGGGSHSLALTDDGFVYAWGLNNYGQLGDGTTTTQTRPVKVLLADGTPLNNVIAISAGFSHSLALTADGLVYAWGINVNGQLGDGTTTQRSNPALIPGFSGVVAIAAGGYHSLALTGDGKVRAWGFNSVGQLGLGVKDFAAHSAPVAVPGLTGITAIAGGGYHSLTVDANGAVSAWGGNNYGQLGDGTTTNRFSPTTVGFRGATAIAAGVYHSLVLNQGAVFGFGYNNYGQLGDGTTLNHSLPILSVITNVDAITAGGYHTLAISAGKLYGCGLNNYGQLGDGTTTNRSIPTASVSVGVVGTVAGGGNHTLLLQAAYASVSGTLSFEQIASTSNNQNVTFLLVPADGSARITRLVSVPASGAFTISGVPQNNYTVWIKGTKYLAASGAADASVGSVSGLTALLGAGDANNDNSVDTSDFGVLVGAYNGDVTVPGSGYDETADFNGDGVIDTTDFGLLVGQYNNVGAPQP